MALNLPGPAACSRLRDLGASVVKVEPPRGDPMEMYCPAWYARLHDDVTVKKLDLKEDADRRAMDELLLGADLFVTAQRTSALARLGLGAGALAERFPKSGHMDGKVVFLDKLVFPYPVEQIVFRENLAMTFDQSQQQIEGL